jgi:hypothetical protein
MEVRSQEDAPAGNSSPAAGVERRRRRRILPDKTTALLRHLADTARERVSVGRLVAGLGRRAFGLALLIFALFCCIPTPPGGATFAGIAILFITLQLMFGRERLWLPRFVRQKTVSRDLLTRMVDRTLPWVARFEKLCRPRLALVSGGVGRIFIGLVLIVLAIVIILPIPVLGNLPPGVAVAAIAIGLSEQDGVVLLGGMVMAFVALAAISTAIHATAAALIG